MNINSGIRAAVAASLLIASGCEPAENKARGPGGGPTQGSRPDSGITGPGAAATGNAPSGTGNPGSDTDSGRNSAGTGAGAKVTNPVEPAIGATGTGPNSEPAGKRSASEALGGGGSAGSGAGSISSGSIGTGTAGGNAGGTSPSPK